MIGLSGHWGISYGCGGLLPTGNLSIFRPASNTFDVQSGIHGTASLHINTSKEELSGVWVQLVTVITTKKYTCKSISQTNVLDGKKTDPIVKLLRGPRTTLRKGTYRYTFNLSLQERPVPASLSWGSCDVDHALVLVAQNYHGNLRIVDEKPIITSGSLKIPPELLCGIRVRNAGSYSEENKPSAIMSLSKKAYLADETIRGAINVENITSEAVSISVELYRTMITSNEGFKLSISKASYAGEYDGDPWEFALELPTSMMPTYKSPNVYFRVFYQLKFSVTLADGSMLNGGTKIVIGTHYGTGESFSNEPEDDGQRPRADSAGRSESLDQSTTSLPPSYSSVSPRRSSLSTLPAENDAAPAE